MTINKTRVKLYVLESHTQTHTERLTRPTHPEEEGKYDDAHNRVNKGKG